MYRYKIEAQSEPRRSGPQRRRPGICTLHLELAPVDLVAAGREQDIEVLAAEREVRDPSVGGGKDRVDPAGLVADLDAEPRGGVEPSVAVDADAIRPGVVGGVGGMEPVVALLRLERTVRRDPVTVDPVRAVIGDVEQSLVG